MVSGCVFAKEMVQDVFLPRKWCQDVFLGDTRNTTHVNPPYPMALLEG